MALMDGNEVEIILEQELGSSGKDDRVDYTIRNLSGFKVKGERTTGNKVERAMPFAAQIEGGNVSLVKGERNNIY